jgi:hypothetical protein
VSVIKYYGFHVRNDEIENVARMEGKKKNAHNLLVGKRKEKIRFANLGLQ